MVQQGSLAVNEQRRPVPFRQRGDWRLFGVKDLIAIMKVVHVKELTTKTQRTQRIQVLIFVCLLLCSLCLCGELDFLATIRLAASLRKEPSSRRCGKRPGRWPLPTLCIPLNLSPVERNQRSPLPDQPAGSGVPHIG